MIKLTQISTTPDEGVSRKKIEKKTKQLVQRLGELQHLMYAEGKHSLLVVFQGMDASGKDGAARRIFRYCSPTGVNSYAFKKPTELEFAHDFLWRVHQQAPQKGRIQIFNRSHYEDILIQRVHKWIDEDRVRLRMEAINKFEELLKFDNNTTILKFYMHISQDNQKEELQERIDEPNKNWKHNPNDWKEAELWDEYMKCYEYVINQSTIPWHIIPVDKRWYRDYVISKILVETMEGLNMQLPYLEDLEE